MGGGSILFTVFTTFITWYYSVILLVRGFVVGSFLVVVLHVGVAGGLLARFEQFSLKENASSVLWNS